MAGIIWLASYPKSGNTWLRAFLANLVANRATPAGTNANGTYQVNVTQSLGVSGPHPELEKSVSALSGGLARCSERPSVRNYWPPNRSTFITGPLSGW